MPNTKQAKKRMKQDELKRLDNKAVKSRMRSAIKKVLGAPDAQAAQAAMPEAMKRIDKAAKKHIIHENAAARYKSRIAANAAKKG